MSGKSSPNFLCNLSSVKKISPPSDTISPFVDNLNKKIAEKANKTRNPIQRVLLKHKVFKHYIYTGIVSLDNLPSVTLSNMHRYTNGDIQKLVIKNILRFDNIATLSQEKYDQIKFSAIKTLDGQVELGKILEEDIPMHKSPV